MSDDGEQLVLLQLPACADRLRLVRSAVREVAEMCGCSEATAQDIQVAVGEACQNIIRHAYNGDDKGILEIGISRREGVLIFKLQDYARSVDTAAIKPRQPEQNQERLKPGGLGVYLIHEIMDEVDYLTPPSGKGNLLRLLKRIG